MERSSRAHEFTVVFQPEGKVAKYHSPISLIDAVRELRIDITSLCGGKGLCGRCKVLVKGGGIRPVILTDIEKKHLAKEEQDRGYRLACCIQLVNDAEVLVPSSSRGGKQRLQTQSFINNIRLNPSIKKYFIKLEKPTFSDYRSDENRLINALENQYCLKNLEVDFNLLHRLPALLRRANWQITAVIKDHSSVINVEIGDTSKVNLGFAVDIGTTKLAGYLVDLNTGEIIATSSMINPQIVYGEDIMTRMSYANRSKKNSAELHRIIVNGVNQLIKEACKKAKMFPFQIYELAAVGNTAMHHFFLGLETKYMSNAPFPQVVSRKCNVKPQKLGININSTGNIFTLPTIAGFVGSDNTAVLLVTRIYESKKPAFAIDIGTNTEIDCGNKEKGVLVTSCAAGSAFEGWGIRWGTRATSGAVEQVTIDPETFEVFYKTIDNAPATGICGSGFVDALAEMLKAGIIGVKPLFNKELRTQTKRLRKGESGYEFVIVRKDESGVNKDIVITQKDIFELVKAKAAIHSGIELLMEKLGIKKEDVGKFYVAGAFGSYVNPESAIIIGLFPEIRFRKINVIGNAAGNGTILTLVNQNKRKEAEKIASKVKFIQLATDPNFVKEFGNSMYLPHKDLTKYPLTVKLLKKRIESRRVHKFSVIL